MPRGTIHKETGILRRATVGYALEMDGGGRWMLDMNGSARKLVGKRVTIEGKRMGFDLIFVDRVWFEGRRWQSVIWDQFHIWLALSMIFAGMLLPHF